MHAQHRGWAVLAAVAFSEVGSVDQGGSRDRPAPHGTYALKRAEGMQVRRFPCPKTRRTASPPPNSLASHLPGTSAEACKTFMRALESLFLRHDIILNH